MLGVFCIAVSGIRMLVQSTPVLIAFLFTFDRPVKLIPRHRTTYINTPNAVVYFLTTRYKLSLPTALHMAFPTDRPLQGLGFATDRPPKLSPNYQSPSKNDRQPTARHEDSYRPLSARISH